MNTEILNFGIAGVALLLIIKELFSYLKSKKNGSGDYKTELISINNKLSNHLTDVNGKIGDIEREMTQQSIDIKIIKNCINDIKIAIKQ